MAGLGVGVTRGLSGRDRGQLLRVFGLRGEELLGTDAKTSKFVRALGGDRPVRRDLMLHPIDELAQRFINRGHGDGNWS